MKSISDAQREELEAQARKALLAKGMAPSADDIQKWIREEYTDIAFGNPSVRIYHQARGGKLDAVNFLRFLKTAFFDAKVLHRVLRSDTVDMVDETIARNERFMTAISNIDELESRLEQAESALSNETEVKERIKIDLLNDDHIDQANTSAIIDASSRSILLPMLPAKTTRVLTDTMRLAASPRVSLINVDAKNVLRNTPLNGQNLKNALMDSDRPWMQEIALQKHTGPLIVEVSFAISTDPFSSHEINRVELEPSISNTGDIEVYFSDGGQQYLQFGDKALANVRKSIIVGDPSRVQRVKLRFVISGPSYSSGREHVYVLGLSALRLFNASYRKAAEFLTDPMPISNLSFISGLGIQAVDTIPGGTRIRYYASMHNDYEDTDWVELTPVGRDGGSAPQEISSQSFYTFQGSTIPVDENGIPQNTDGDGNRIYPYLYKYDKGLGFYAIGKINEERLVDKFRSKLYRGIGQWEFDDQELEVNGSVRGEYINFALRNGTQYPYVYVTEKALVVSGLGSSNGAPSSDDVLLRVTHDIDYVDSILPPDNYIDEGDATHAIEYVKRSSYASENRLYGGAIVASSARSYLVPEDSSQLSGVRGLDRGPVLIFVQYASGGGDYVEIIGRTSATDDDGNQITVMDVRKRGGGLWLETKLLEYWQVSFENMTELVDVASMLSTLTTDKRTIKMKANTLVMPGDEVEIKYRARVSPESGIYIRRNTLSMQSDEGRSLVEGQDYFINPVTGALTSHESIRTAYASFQYTRRTTTLYVISAWFYNEESVQVAFGDLEVQPDKESGEGVYLDVGEGTRSIDGGALIEFTPGWHKLTVTGRSIARMILLKDLKDTSGSVVFAKGRYFDQQMAFKTGLSHVDEFSLYNRSMKGKPAGFSILDDGIVLVPFDPFQSGLTSDYYSVYKGEADNGTERLARIAEQFDIYYSYIRGELLEEDSSVTPEALASQGEAVPLKGRHVYDKVSVKAVLEATGERGLRITPMIRQMAVDLK